MGNGGEKLEVVLEVMEVREVDILDKTSQLNYDVEKVNEGEWTFISKSVFALSWRNTNSDFAIFV